jgi:predicted metal-dependent peptidase
MGRPVISRLETALQELWKRSRFTSYFFQSVQFTEENHIPTLALHVTDHRVSLLYNVDFFKQIHTEELIGLLVHEMMHIILNHHHRSLQHQDTILLNLAQDMVVNSYLIDSKETFFFRKHTGARDTSCLVLPSGLPEIPAAFFDEQASMKKEDVTWEVLYQWLVSRRKQNRSDKTEDIRNDPDDFQLKNFLLPGQAPNEDLQFNHQGLSFHDKTSVILPAGIHLFRTNDHQTSVEALKERIIHYSIQDETCRNERFFQHISAMIQKIQPVQKPSWKEMIKAFVESSAMSGEWKYSASRFDRRYFAAGLFAPGRTYSKEKIVTVAVDVSGSMVAKPEDIETAFGVIESLLKQHKVYLLCIDEEVFVPYKHNDTLQKSRNPNTSFLYRKGDWRYLQTGSSGTTFFSPLFDRFMKKHREPLIIITDGEIYDLDQLRYYPKTLWVITGNRDKPFQPPFGKVVMIR